MAIANNKPGQSAQKGAAVGIATTLISQIAFPHTSSVSKSQKPPLCMRSSIDVGRHSSSGHCTQMEPLNFEAVKRKAGEHLLTILETIAPEGELKGDEYLMLNPHRLDGDLNSFKFNLDSGRWADFASDDGDAKGGDIISLVAYLKRMSQAQAAEEIYSLIDSVEVESQAKPRPVRQGRPFVGASQSLSTQVVPVPPHAPSPPDSHPSLGKFSACYTYTDESGRTVCYVCRFELPDGKKEFRPLTLHQSQLGALVWQWQGMDGLRPLYNLHELVMRADAPVLMVEGEKSAEAAKALLPSHVVVTTMNGAQAPQKTDLSPLKGRNVLIWPDHDDAGRAYADKVREVLMRLTPPAVVSVMRAVDVCPGTSVDDKTCLVQGFEPEKGWDAADALQAGWTAEHMKLWLAEGKHLASHCESEVSVNVENDSYTTPDGRFLVKADGVYRIRYKDGEQYETKISSKIEKVAQTLDDDGAWGLMLRITDPDGVAKEWMIRRSLLASPAACRGELLNRGADVYPSGKDGDSLIEYLMESNPMARVRYVGKPGWSKDTVREPIFVLPGRVVGDSHDRIDLQSSSSESNLMFQSHGGLSDWQHSIGNRCVGNSRLILSVCAALTGPVLDKLGEENGGFHLVGPSSIGKTTAVQVAASVWGRHDLYVKSWRATTNALESVAVLHNDTLLILDEISQVNPSEAGEVSYMLGNGKGKSRADRNASSRDVKSWRLLFLSTGELSLASHMQAGNVRAMTGQEVRLINLTADAGAGMGLFQNLHNLQMPQEFAQQIKQAALVSNGVAGPAFVAALMSRESGQALLDRVEEVVNQFISDHVPADASGQVYRVGRRFGLLAGVGEAAIQAGVLPWPEGEARTGIRTCFQSWLDGRGGAGNQETDQAIAQVRRFLEQHGESRFTPWDEIDELNANSRTINRAGFRRITNDDRTEYYVLPEVYRKEVCAGMDAREVTKALRARNFLVLGSDQKSQRQERLPGIGPMKVYRIKADILNDAD